MSEKPNIINFIDEQASDELHIILRGHLYIEYLLNEIIDKKTPNPSALRSLNLGFFKKVQYLLAIRVLNDELADLLLSLNNIRNSYAHRLDYRVNFDIAFDLVLKAANAGIDFSDETIFRDRQLSEDCYGIYGVLHEVVSNTFQHLVWLNEDVFTQDDISEFLG